MFHSEPASALSLLTVTVWSLWGNPGMFKYLGVGERVISFVGYIQQLKALFASSSGICWLVSTVIRTGFSNVKKLPYQYMLLNGQRHTYRFHNFSWHLLGLKSLSRIL